MHAGLFYTLYIDTASYIYVFTEVCQKFECNMIYCFLMMFQIGTNFGSIFLRLKGLFSMLRKKWCIDFAGIYQKFTYIINYSFHEKSRNLNRQHTIFLYYDWVGL